MNARGSTGAVSVIAVALLAGAPSCDGSSLPQGTHDEADASDAAVAEAAIPDSGSSLFDGSFTVPEAMGPLIPCNGDPNVCAKTYDAVTYATSHGAMAYATPPFVCPAQMDSVRTQLDHGIRALDLEAHAEAPSADGGAALDLCLGDCSRGSLPIASALSDVSAFLSVNPREIVTLLVEGGVAASDLASAFVAAGLDVDAFTKGATDPWPTLDAMIAGGHRVVVLADVTGDAPSWMMPLWTLVDETGRAFTSTAAMTCDVTRGSQGAPLFLLNEFLVDDEAGVPPAVEADAALVAADAGPDATLGESASSGYVGCDDPALAAVANADPFLTNRVMACSLERGRRPTFLSADDIDIGVLSQVAFMVNAQP